MDQLSGGEEMEMTARACFGQLCALAISTLEPASVLVASPSSSGHVLRKYTRANEHGLQSKALAMTTNFRHMVSESVLFL